MLAKAVSDVPAPDSVAGGLSYEPKWDGFRCIVLRDGDEVELASRGSKPLTRYFPEVVEAVRLHLPPRCAIDAELVVRAGLPGGQRLDWASLTQRIHPADSRVQRLARETPAELICFDILALGDQDLTGMPFGDCRERLESALSGLPADAPVHLTRTTTHIDTAREWFERFEGAGLDGVVAKRTSDPYMPGKRGWAKIKHARTADCVVAGFRWHKNGPGTLVGSLLLGLFDETGRLNHVGITASFTVDKRRELVEELAPWRENALEGHPWAEWAMWEAAARASGQRMPGAASRWNRDRDLTWEPLRAERVCEVAYDHLQGDRFRHATTFRRWRPDKAPADCRYDQLESTAPFELGAIFGR